jgi:xanthine dehydrogenase accessory factor
VSETSDIIAAFTALEARGEPTALATIVGTRGSTYRGAGARLLVAGRGQVAGNISGGCLEGDVEERAREVIASGSPELLHFDLTADDDAVWGWGLGCNGAVDIFLEPPRTARVAMDALRLAADRETPLAVATVIESSVPGIEPGARTVTDGSGRGHTSLGEPAVDAAVIEAARAALDSGVSATSTLEVAAGRLSVFVEAMLPAPRLIVCGAGHDAIPLVRFAAGLGWRVVVADERRAMLSRERFPEATALVNVPAERLGQAVRLDAHTSAVVMSHNYLRDMGYLRALLGTEIAYLGMLGPQLRAQRLLGDLEREGIRASEADLARIHAPAGLDIGADGPEEIAWAIVAEILATFRRRPGGPLRERPGRIHGDGNPAEPLAAGAAGTLSAVD